MAAKYRVCDMDVTIKKKSYRAIVVHSDAHDKRWQKRLDRMLEESYEQAYKDTEEGREGRVLLP